LLLEPPKHLAVNVFRIYVPTKACVEDDIVGLITDVNDLGCLTFLVEHQASKERLSATVQGQSYLLLSYLSLTLTTNIE
jgi:hypothetical protein